MPAHHSVGSFTLERTPISSILLSYSVTLALSGMGTWQGGEGGGGCRVRVGWRLVSI